MQLSIGTPPARGPVAVVAATTLLNPLNTSMIAAALPDLERAFGVGAGASWLLSAFAVASAVGHPLAGRLSDHFGPRRVVVVGLAVVGVGGLIAALAPSFAVLVAARTLQALGTATAFPAGMACFRHLAARGGGQVPPRWLGAVTIANQASAALGPVIGGALVAAAGWPAIFAINVPVVAVLIPLAARHVQDVPPRRAAGPRVAARGALWSIYARFAMLCTVFYAAFFALPPWLHDARGLGRVAAGLVVAPIVGAAVLAMPLAVWWLSRRGARRVLVVGAGGLVIATVLWTAIDPASALGVVVAVSVSLGIAMALHQIALQAELVEVAARDQQASAAGWFQTARFAGALAAAGLLGLTDQGATTHGFHALAIASGLLSIVLLAWSARRSTRRGQKGIES